MYQLYGYMARGRPPGLLWPWGFRGERRHERLIEPEHQGDTANNLIAVGHPNFVGTHAGHVVVVLEGSGGGTTSGSLGPTRARSAGVLRSERLTHLFQPTAAADLVQPGGRNRRGVLWPSHIRSDRPAMAPNVVQSGGNNRAYTIRDCSFKLDLKIKKCLILFEKSSAQYQVHSIAEHSESPDWSRSTVSWGDERKRRGTSKPRLNET